MPDQIVPDEPLQSISDPQPGAKQASWALLQPFMLRQAGFPFGILDMLKGDEVLSAVSNHSAALQALSSVGGTARQAVKSDQSLEPQHKARLHSAIASSRPVGDMGSADIGEALSEALSELAKARFNEVAARRRLADDVHSYESAVAQAIGLYFIQCEPFRRALLMSNAAFFHSLRSASDAWVAGAFDGKAHKTRLDTAVMYLQRFAAKNDTASNYGPFSVGMVQRAGASLSGSAVGGEVRAVYPTAWAASAIGAACLTELPLDHVPVLAGGIAVLDGHILEIRNSFGSPWEQEALSPRVQDPESLRLIELIDGRSLRLILDEAAAELGGYGRAAELWQRLVEEQIVEPAGRPRVGAHDPIDDVATTLGSAAKDVQPLVAQIRELAVLDAEERLDAVAQIESTFSRLSAADPTRSHGEFEADRSIFFEEVRLETSGLTIGGELADEIERLVGLYLDLLLLSVKHRIFLERALLSEWFHRQFGRKPVEVHRFVQNFHADPGLAVAFDSIDADTQRVERSLLGHLDLDPESAQIDIDAGLVREIIAEYDQPMSAIANPDVLVVATDRDSIEAGQYSLVAEDVHAARELLTHCSATPLMADSLPAMTHQVAGAYDALCRPDEQILDVYRTHQRKTDLQVPLPIPALEAAGKSIHTGPTYRLRDLFVVPTESGLRLSTSKGQFVRLTAPLVGNDSCRSDPLIAFAFPRRHGRAMFSGLDLPHLPRIVVDGRLVVSRETWRIPVDRWHRSSQRGLAADVSEAVAIAAEHDLPRYGFAWLASEPKPLYVDQQSPLLLRQWRRRAIVCEAGDPPTGYTEMLPAPNQLWWNVAGRMHTSELRLLMARPGPEARGWPEKRSRHDPRR